MNRYDVLIVGGGPAGLSAALVLGRCRRRVLVLDDGEPRNAPSRALHGYLTRDGCPPSELLRLGREEVARYGVEVLDAHVVEAEPIDDGFRLTLADGRTFDGKKLLLATGIRDQLPEVEGADAFFGRGLYYCPYCDGWEHRDRPLAAYGRGSAAVGLAVALRTWSAQVTACTDGEAIPAAERAWLEQNGVALREEPILRLEGDGHLERIVFAAGPPLACEALFFHTARVQHSDLPRRLGCANDSEHEAESGPHQRAPVPGVYLAGDADGDTEFVITAAAEGAQAAVTINHDLQQEERTPRPESRG